MYEVGGTALPTAEDPRRGRGSFGDAVAAASATGAVMLGVFNVYRDLAVASFRRSAALDAETACFGHGGRVTADASRALRESADACAPTR
ncbi:hypothetical protein ACFWPQ_01315 [Streptomyces sp. NPDC058464]|uniref:hypothetical protein n=1 Tax=Streptomyces sp. NPDC058464 TaxID=3346511 RepID=UPI00365D9DF6